MAKRKVGELFRINIMIPLWCVLVGGILTFSVAYFCTTQYRDQIKFSAVLLGVSAAIYSAYYMGVALRLQISHNRQKTSFELIGLLNCPEYVKVRNFIEKEVEGHEKVSAEELYKKINDNQELDDAVTTVMGILEDMAIAIRFEYVDEDIIYSSLLAIVERNWRGLRGWVEQLRKKRNDQGLLCELQELITSWESGKRLSDSGKLPDASR